MSEFIELGRIRTDGGTQPRASTFEDTLKAYVEDMGRGDAFPPITIFFDGTDHWLADGFHRFNAAKSLGKNGLMATVRQGTQRDAILFSVGANADHGRPRTNEDKRRAVLRLLEDGEWGAESANWIAAQCRVSQPFVAKLKAELAPAHLQTFEDRPRTAHRGGSTYTMNTGAIGRSPESRPSPPPVAAPVPPPPVPTPVETFKASMADGAPIFDAIEAIKARFADLPDAEDAARRFPQSLRYTFSQAQADHIAAWFTAFGEAWAIENGAQNVAAE